jgi:hypothetical protein
MPPTVSFDVIGTCFAFEAPIAAIQDRLGPTLSKHSVDAKTLFFSWWYVSSVPNLPAIFQVNVTPYNAHFGNICYETWSIHVILSSS